MIIHEYCEKTNKEFYKLLLESGLEKCSHEDEKKEDDVNRKTDNT